MIATASRNIHERTAHERNGHVPLANGDNGLPETAPAVLPGRDTAGRFAPGNPGGPGNPFTRQVAQLRKAFLAAATPDRLARLADALHQQALGGDTAAAKLYLAYVLGRPPEAPNPDRVALDEWAIHQAMPGQLELAQLLVRHLTPELANDQLRHLLPATEAMFLAQLPEAANEPAPSGP